MARSYPLGHLPPLRWVQGGGAVVVPPRDGVLGSLPGGGGHRG